MYMCCCSLPSACCLASCERAPPACLSQGSRKLEGREQKGKAGSTWLHKAKSVVGGALGGRSSVRYILRPKVFEKQRRCSWLKRCACVAWQHAAQCSASKGQTVRPQHVWLIRCSKVMNRTMHHMSNLCDLPKCCCRGMGSATVSHPEVADDKCSAALDIPKVASLHSFACFNCHCTECPSTCAGLSLQKEPTAALQSNVLVRLGHKYLRVRGVWASA